MTCLVLSCAFMPAMSIQTSETVMTAHMVAEDMRDMLVVLPLRVSYMCSGCCLLHSGFSHFFFALSSVRIKDGSHCQEQVVKCRFTVRENKYSWPPTAQGSLSIDSTKHTWNTF